MEIVIVPILRYSLGRSVYYWCVGWRRHGREGMVARKTQLVGYCNRLGNKEGARERKNLNENTYFTTVRLSVN